MPTPNVSSATPIVWRVIKYSIPSSDRILT